MKTPWRKLEAEKAYEINKSELSDDLILCQIDPRGRRILNPWYYDGEQLYGKSRYLYADDFEYADIKSSFGDYSYWIWKDEKNSIRVTIFNK